jgi:hypothetical protein
MGNTIYKELVENVSPFTVLKSLTLTDEACRRQTVDGLGVNAIHGSHGATITRGTRQIMTPKFENSNARRG